MRLAQIKKAVSKYLETDLIQFLGEGDFCSAYLVDRQWVFRFARHDEARKSLEREFCLLPKIVDKISLQIPDPELASFNQEPSFIAYRFLPDNSLSQELYLQLDETERTKCAVQVADFLNQLHSIETTLAQKCGVKLCDYQSKYERILSEAKENLFPVLAKAERQFVEEIIDQYLTSNNTFQPALLHGDLSPDHVLFDKETRSVSGIIDFGDLMIGDPVWDLLWIYEDYGLDFLAGLLPEFHLTDKKALLQRLFQFSRLEFIDWMLRCQKNDDRAFSETITELQKMREEREPRFDELLSVCTIG